MQSLIYNKIIVDVKLFVLYILSKEYIAVFTG